MPPATQVGTAGPQYHIPTSPPHLTPGVRGLCSSTPNQNSQKEQNPPQVLCRLSVGFVLLKEPQTSGQMEDSDFMIQSSFTDKCVSESLRRKKKIENPGMALPLHRAVFND